MRHQTELLAPAGSFESLRAAVNAGADAVYIGGTRFGARAYAENPDEKGLCEAIEFAHLHGCDLYLTVNTLLKDAELEELGTYLKPYYESGLDAVIVQDMGVFSYIRENFPDSGYSCQHPDDGSGRGGSRISEKAGSHPGGDGPGAVLTGDTADSRYGGCGDRKLYPRSPLLTVIPASV